MVFQEIEVPNENDLESPTLLDSDFLISAKCIEPILEYCFDISLRSSTSQFSIFSASLSWIFRVVEERSRSEIVIKEAETGK